MSNKVTLKHCVGCRDNFYNGHNELGVKRCWHFASAKFESRLDIPIQQRPPYKIPPTKRPSCYHADGYARVKPESLTPEGFWKS